MLEFESLSNLIKSASRFGQTKVLAQVHAGKEIVPIHGITIGVDDPTLPTLGLFAGVHGLERVGSHVVMNYLAPLLDQLRWDQDMRNQFRKMRIVTIPIVNPGGMLLGTRSNPNGVDIMRNAPIEAVGNVKPLVSGHRISKILPWYRGPLNSEMEIETQTLLKFIRSELLPSQFSIALDVHSGFGMHDRLWYPYSRSKEKFFYIDDVLKMKTHVDQALPFHIYKIEPQSDSYIMHGDPWDYIFEEHKVGAVGSKRKFLPWCLEMGSWTWIKKNPKQFFYKAGIFNPILPHRYGRIMRRHKPLLDLLSRFVLNSTQWNQPQEGATL